MLIRQIREEDLPVCGRIYADAFSKPPYKEVWEPAYAADMLEGLLERDPESCWCAEEEGEVAGFAFCTRFGKFRATIQEFAVAPRFQKRGFGTALMEYALDQFRQQGIKTTDLVVNRDAPAFMLYRRFGFRQPERYILMAKWL